MRADNHYRKPDSGNVQGGDATSPLRDLFRADAEDDMFPA
jgi:hypothetical protein